MNKRRFRATYRIGEKKMQNCGMVAQIIDYRKSSDISVQFEDKTIVPSATYSNFSNGLIRHPLLKKANFKNRVGESKKMNNGVVAKIIAYRNATDLDVEFQTKQKQIVRHKTYESFLNGRITFDHAESVKRATQTRAEVRQKKYANADIKIQEELANAGIKIEESLRLNDELLLKLYDQYSAPQIAHAINRKLPTVKYWISQAQEKQS